MIKLGFNLVIEAALGADIVANHEAKELQEKTTGGLLVNSCCYPFSRTATNISPELSKHLSSSLSPMRQLENWSKTNMKARSQLFL
ncbi:hypothetical protein N752_13875 [Desulforamulus aquiferis]|nr:hypothetical protein N752_13875 [Desulforamulus aquiferis]